MNVASSVAGKILKHTRVGRDLMKGTEIGFSMLLESLERKVLNGDMPLEQWVAEARDGLERMRKDMA